VLALIRMVESVLPEGSDHASAASIASTLIGSLQIARVLGGEEGRAVLAASRKALLERYDA
jgi:hypothetical protein